MNLKASILMAALAGVASTNPLRPVPTISGATICDGLTRPDWAECQANIDSIIDEEIIVGPGLDYGRTFTYDNCQIRFDQCIKIHDGIEFVVEYASSLFNFLADSCADSGGGVRREGDLCITVDNPSNPFTPPTISTEGRTLDRRGIVVEQPAWPASEGAPSDDDEEVSKRSHPRDLLNAEDDSNTLERRQDDECLDCYSYSEAVLSKNVRGERRYVCDNILPDGAACTETHTATVTESFDVGFTASAGLFDIITAGASFTTSYSEAVSVSLSTTITVDCPGGSGYIVWYPLMEVSRGDCFTGECSGANCVNTQRHSCGSRRPIMPGPNRLSGEYDFICV